MASTTYAPGQAVFVASADAEPLIGFVVGYDDESFDLTVTDQGSRLNGETLTVFGSEIRSGAVRVHRIA